MTTKSQSTTTKLEGSEPTDRIWCANCANQIYQSGENGVPTVDHERETVDRTQLLTALRDGMNTCIENAKDQTKPQAYRMMMEHFAEAGRQILEMIEEGRYSGPISAPVCEGCGKPTVVVQVTDDDVVLCPLCYAATPETTPSDRIQCPHCHWRPSPALRPVNGLCKCANCDFKWSVASTPDESRAASPVAPQQSEPWRDGGGYAWERRPNVECVECPHCCFVFDAIHTSQVSPTEWAGYECPNCEGRPDVVPAPSAAVQDETELTKLRHT